jgi:hypothetical protein
MARTTVARAPPQRHEHGHAHFPQRLPLHLHHAEFLGASGRAAHRTRQPACIQRIRRPAGVPPGMMRSLRGVVSHVMLTVAVQYEVIWPDTYVTEKDATSLLSQHASPSSSSAMPASQETQELSKRDKAAPASLGDDAVEHTYEAVVLQGQRYLCSIPTIPDEVPQNSTTTAEEAKAEEEKELARATDRGWELLEPMKDNCIYYLSGWWSYSFCYKKQVKQFHQPLR